MDFCINPEDNLDIDAFMRVKFLSIGKKRIGEDNDYDYDYNYEYYNDYYYDPLDKNQTKKNASNTCFNTNFLPLLRSIGQKSVMSYLMEMCSYQDK